MTAPQLSDLSDALLRAASRKYSKAAADYRARKTNDAEFLAARAENKAAQLAFDNAFAKETANN